MFGLGKLDWAQYDFIFEREHNENLRPVLLPSLDQRQEFRKFKEVESNVWKTNYGGLFSLLYVVLALTLCAVLLLQYVVSNLVETRGLIPDFAMSSQMYSVVRSDMALDVTVPGYGGICGPNDQALHCDAAISVDVGGTLRSDAVAGAENRLQCINSEVDCSVRWRCPKCFVSGDSAYILISLRQAASYGNGISWKFATSTGYAPPQQSIVASDIFSDGGVVLRGREPNVVNLFLTTAWFQSDQFGGVNGTGFMTEFVNTVRGTTSNATNFGLNAGLFLLINISRSDAIFTVTREHVFIVANGFAQISGALVVLMGGLVALLALAERRVLEQKRILQEQENKERERNPQKFRQRVQRGGDKGDDSEQVEGKKTLDDETEGATDQMAQKMDAVKQSVVEMTEQGGQVGLAAATAALSILEEEHGDSNMAVDSGPMCSSVLGREE
jgi:hypothetical protein